MGNYLYVNSLSAYKWGFGVRVSACLDPVYLRLTSFCGVKLNMVKCFIYSWLYVCLTEPAVTAQTQQSQVIEVVWDDPVARCEILALYLM